MAQEDGQNQNLALIESINLALDNDDIAAALKELDGLHPSEIADILESLPGESRVRIWVELTPELEGEILSHMHEDVRTSLLEGMSADELATATRDLESDDVVDILQALPEDVADEILMSMDAQNRARLSAILSFPEDTAGGLMNIDTVTTRADVSIDVVLRYLRLLGELPSGTDSLMVVDRDNIYLGTLPLETLVTSDPERMVGEVMSMDAVTVVATSTAEDVARVFEQRDLISAAVTNDEGLLLGRITIDDVVDVIRDQNDQSLLGLAGVRDEYDIFAPVVDTARRRAAWLAVNLATAFLASYVIGLFEVTLSELVALAILLPVVASMGGIAGSQTLTIVVRGMAVGQIGGANARPLLLKELAVGLMNGVVWAAVVAIAAGFWFSSVALGAVLGAAMIINLVTAAFAGSLIPLILKRLKVDPALAGGVVLTTVTDVVGFAAFLGLATVFLI